MEGSLTLGYKTLKLAASSSYHKPKDKIGKAQRETDLRDRRIM